MSDPLSALLQDFCETVGLPSSQVLARRQVHVKGVDVQFTHYEDDAEHFHITFQFGTTSAGRALKVFRLMLEANVLIYARDSAQLGMDPDTGGVVLLVRVAFDPLLDGQWLADTLAHYAEHGQYWQENILSSSDEMFIGIASGQYQWIRA